MMTTEKEIKQQVREFYDQVGWKMVADGVYQNARYEDLRPVAREYITGCHQRVARHISAAGHLLLDAGSGPIQYPEYLEYSRGYRRRVCADISITALQEARKRAGEHGLYVVADIAKLPFKAESFDGVVSLHTIHHLPQEDHIPAYRDVYRVLAAGRTAALVNGWNNPPLVRLMEAPILLRRRLSKLRHGQAEESSQAGTEPKGTFVRKYNAAWLHGELKKYMAVEILVWRSVSVKALRFYIKERWGGRGLLRILFWLEERLPRFLGKYGQYPLIVIHKP
ncbi:MAG: class I SAM-dependent methyltransferase [Anaerolineae bacterium]|nr:class I SAM-dependent methyltransferase [Anaerolineae bacterium]